MILSVFNKSTGRYSIYESSSTPVKSLSLSGSSMLGAAPEDEVDALPPDAEYIGESETAQGMIVKTTYTIGSLLLSVAAAVLARWVYDRWFK